MDVPSPQAGVISEVLVKKGTRVSQGTPLINLEAAASASAPAAEAPKAAPAAATAAPAPSHQRHARLLRGAARPKADCDA